MQGIPGLETMFERTSITLAIKHLWCFGRMLGSDVSVKPFSDLCFEAAVRAIVNSSTFPLVDDISRIHPEHPRSIPDGREQMLCPNMTSTVVCISKRLVTELTTVTQICVCFDAMDLKHLPCYIAATTTSTTVRFLTMHQFVPLHCIVPGCRIIALVT